MKRVFHISNRVDIPETGKATAGGLDEAIAEAPEGYQSVRFGWSGKIVDNDVQTLDETVQITTRGPITYITYDMREKELDQFYNFVANGIIWPASHYREDIAREGFAARVKTDQYQYGARGAIEGYYKVNREVAELARKFIGSDDTVMVHDYHFIPLAAHLNVPNPTGFFYHIPMLNSDLLETFDREQQKFFHQLLSHLYHYDLVGLQTPRDVESLKSIIGEDAPYKTPPVFETQAFRKTPNNKGISTQFGAFPVAGDAPKYTALAKAWEDRAATHDYIRDHANGELDMISVERRDYTKGIIPKVHGVGRWLSQFGQNGDRIHLVQVAPKGREAVRAYQDESMRIETTVESINEMFGKDLVHLDHNKVDRGLHLGLARHSNAALITPLRDGMNLYVGEYIAAQVGRDKPGMAIVSKFAGAASIYNGALISVDPYKPESIARGIETARNMSPMQRQDLLGKAMDIQKFFTNQRWQSSLIKATENAPALTP